VGSANPKEVLEVFEYAAKKYGISHFVIDSLMRLDIPEDEDARLKELMNACSDFAMNYDVHLHLVAHSKKPDAKKPEESGWPSKHMVRGSVHVTNIAHNVVCVWRNKKKERFMHEIADNQITKRPEDREVAAMSDSTFAVLAQRENGEEPIANLWFDKDCWQYKETHHENSLVYVR
jgi:twinkle protein